MDQSCPFLSRVLGARSPVTAPTYRAALVARQARGVRVCLCGCTVPCHASSGRCRVHLFSGAAGTRRDDRVQRETGWPGLVRAGCDPTTGQALNSLARAWIDADVSEFLNSLTDDVVYAIFDGVEAGTFYVPLFKKIC